MSGKSWFRILILFGILTTLLSGAILILSRGTPQGLMPFDHYEMVASLLGGLIFTAVGVGGMLKAPADQWKPLSRVASGIIGLGGGLVMLTIGGIRIAETLAQPDGFEQATVLYYCIFILYGLLMLTLPMLSRTSAVSVKA